jgi:uncharacterized protein HemX
MKSRIFLLTLLFFITINIFAQTGKEAKTPIANSSTPESSEVSPQETQETKNYKLKITNLENEVFWLALLAALGFILPLPLGFYHIYRTRELVSQMTELEAKLNEQSTKASQIGSLVARNQKLEDEIKEVQERFRTTMKNTQEKYQTTIERMKDDMHLLDLENKRISGILMLKEQVAKKSSPGA